MIATSTIQTYSEIVKEAWMRYCEQCHEASWFTSDQVHVVDGLRQLKRQSIEKVLGDDINAPKAVVFTQLKKPELFLPGVIVAQANPLFEKEIKKEVLSATPYKLTEFRLRFRPDEPNSKIGINYLMLTDRTYRKDAISEAEETRLRDFAEDCIDLSILFADRGFRKVCSEFSGLPKKVAQTYVKNLQLRGGKTQ